VNHLKVRSCLIDGEVVCCDEQGVAAFRLHDVCGLQHQHQVAVRGGLGSGSDSN
jgi:hypothetical protein